MKHTRLAFIAMLLSLVAAPFAIAQKSADDLLARENLGGIKIGLPETELAAILGKSVVKKSKDQTNAETGLVFQTWTCADKGLSFQMTHEDGAKGAMIVSAFTASGKCPLATAKGIKIGSTLAAVRKAYGTLHENAPGEFLAGNAADSAGLFFTIKDGKVSAIFFGVAT